MEKEFQYLEAKLATINTTLAEHMQMRKVLEQIKNEYNKLSKEAK